MLSEDFDKKIKEAAENHSTSYDESSWDKMVVLLNRYLPEKRDRRRYFLFLFLFLVMGGGGVTLLLNLFSANKPSVVSDNKTGPGVTINNPGDNTPEKEKTGWQTAPDKPRLTMNSGSGNQLMIKQPAVNIKNWKRKQVTENGNLQPFTEKPAGTDKGTTNQAGEKNMTEKPGPTHLPPVSNKLNTAPAPNNNEQKKIEPSSAETGQLINPKTEENKLPDAPVTEGKPMEDPAEKKASSPERNKPKNGFLSRLGISFSTGPEVSFVGWSHAGKTRLVYGAGLSYRLSDRLSARTGFFVGKKVYSTGPENYHPPSNFWNYYPNLKQIDADCKVYEIPLNIDYTFSANGIQRWYVSAGISSLFMKEENYDYLFKPPYSSQYVYYSHSYENENKHYFSQLQLSAGFSRKISPRVSIGAEPYIKLPLKGIGYGKIKLSGSGVLLTASIHPFSVTKKP